MATILRRKSKRDGYILAIQIVHDGRRKTFSVGKMEKRDAKVIGRHVERIKMLSTGCALPSDTIAWLDAIRGSNLDSQLIKAGVLSRDEVTAISIGKWLEQFRSERPFVKSATQITYGYIERNLLDCFGFDKPVSSFTPADGDKFRGWLHENEKLASNTIGRRIGLARQVFDAAKRARLIGENPFGHLKATVRGNPRKFHFISYEDYQKLMKAAPNVTWRCIIALARIGGVRVPSEVLALTWKDVDWNRRRIRITSPKTEGHDGHAERVLPMFPELATALRELFQVTTDPAGHVIEHYRSATQNLRTQFGKIIKRAGLTPWPKLFVNMRASRATELRNQFPEHVCTAWLGHSAKVANEFYLRVRDDDFERAIGAAGVLSSFGASGENASRFANSPENENAFCANEEGCAPDGMYTPYGVWARPDSNREPRDYESHAESSQTTVIGDTYDRSRRALADELTDFVLRHADLDRIIYAWPALPADARKRIGRIVDDTMSSYD